MAFYIIGTILAFLGWLCMKSDCTKNGCWTAKGATLFYLILLIVLNALYALVFCVAGDWPFPQSYFISCLTMFLVPIVQLLQR